MLGDVFSLSKFRAGPWMLNQPIILRQPFQQKNLCWDDCTFGRVHTDNIQLSNLDGRVVKMWVTNFNSDKRSIYKLISIYPIHYPYFFVLARYGAIEATEPPGWCRIELLPFQKFSIIELNLDFWSSAILLVNATIVSRLKPVEALKLKFVAPMHRTNCHHHNYSSSPGTPCNV